MSHMLEEMAEQPALVARLLAELPGRRHSSALGSPQRILFTGCGDMRFAGRLAAAVARQDLGLDAHALPAMDLRYATDRLGAGDLVVAASISGRTPRTREAARLAAERGARVLCIADDPESPLAQEHRDRALILATSALADVRGAAYAGYARPVPQTKTFLAALAAEIAIAHVVAGRTPDSVPIASMLERALAHAAREIPAIAREHFAAVRNVFVLASGPWAGLASYGAAKMLEYAIPAHAQCLEEFQHLEMFVADPGTGIVVLAPDLPSRDRALGITSAWDELGCATLVVGLPGPYRGARVRTLAVEPSALAAQMLALAVPLQRLAFELALVLGRDVDRWVGGVRADAIFRASQRAIRGIEPA